MPAIARVLTVALVLTLSSAGAARPTSAQDAGTDPGAWYAAVRAEFEAMFEDLLTRLSESEAPAGELAQARAQMEGLFRGILANLDTQVDGLERRVLTERAAHAVEEDLLCASDIVASTLFERVGEDPTDAQNALLAGFQCRAAYRGAVSRPATEERESLRELCFIARDRIVQHHDNPEIVFEPERAALYALARCATYRGAASSAYMLTRTPGTYEMFTEAEQIVRNLTDSILRREFEGP